MPHIFRLLFSGKTIDEALKNIREVIEKSYGIYIYGCEFMQRQDFLHYRNSGLNHVLAAIASENRIKFLLNFSDLLNLSNYRKAVVLGRVKQKMRLFGKFKNEFFFASFASDEFGVKKNLDVFKRLIESNKVS